MSLEAEMNEISELLSAIANAPYDAPNIITREENRALAQAVAAFVLNQRNRAVLLDVLYNIMPPLEITQQTATQALKRTYVFFILLLAIAKQYPDCFDDEDFNERRFQMKDEQISMSQLVFLITTTCLINQRDSVQNVEQFFPSTLLFGEELYTFRQPFERYYQPFALGCSELLGRANRVLVELIFDFLAEVRSPELLKQFIEYVFYSLKELSLILKAQQLGLQQSQAACVDALRLREEAEVLILGNMLGAFSSGLARQFCEAALGGGADAVEAQASVAGELGDIVVKVVQYYMRDVEVCEQLQELVVNEAYKTPYHSAATREISAPEDVLRAETFHYFVCSLLLPFYMTCSEVCRCCPELAEAVNYENCCRGVVRFAKALDFAAAIGRVRRVDSVQTSDRCEELFYYDLFKTLTSAALTDPTDAKHTEAQACTATGTVTGVKLLACALSSSDIRMSTNRLVSYVLDKGSIFDASEYYLLMHQAGKFRVEELFDAIEEINKMQALATETQPNSQLDAIGYLLFVRTFILLTEFVQCQRLTLDYAISQDLALYLEQELFMQRDQFFSCIHYIRAENLKSVTLCAVDKEVHFVPSADERLTEAKAFLTTYLNANLYNYLSLLTRAAVRSEETGKAIVAGNIMLLLESGFLSTNRISHLAACLLLVSIFGISDPTFEERYVSLIFKASEDIRIAVIDVIGTAALSYEKGYSLVQTLLYENPNTDSDVDDVQAPLLTPDIGLNFQRSILAFQKQFHDVDCEQPFRFLSELNFLAQMQMDVLLVELRHVESSDFQSPFLDLPLDCEYHPTEFLISEFNAACVYSYILGVLPEFTQITALQRRLRDEFVLNAFGAPTMRYDGFQVLERYSRLRVSLLQILQAEESVAAIDELRSVFELLHLDVQSRLDVLKYQRNMLDDQTCVNKCLIASLFIALLYNDICSDRLRLNAKWAKKEHFKDIYAKFSDPSQCYYGETMILDKPSVDSMVALFALFADKIYDEVQKTEDDTVQALERFCAVAEYGGDRSQLDYTVGNRLLYWSAAFYCASKVHILQRSCENPKQHAQQTIAVFARILADICKQQTLAYQHQKEQLAQALNLSLPAFADFLQEYRAQLAQIEPAGQHGAQRNSLYHLLLYSLIKLTQLYGDDQMTRSSYIIQKELIQLLPPEEQLADDLLNLLCRINVTLELPASEIQQILRGGLILSTDPKDLLLCIKQCEDPFGLCIALLQACQHNKRHYICPATYSGVETPKMTFFDKRNAHLLPLPVSLILVFKFHPALQQYASEVIQYIWNTKETFQFNALTTRTYTQLIALYQDFELSNLCTDKASTFSKEITVCVERALGFICQAGVLQEDEASYNFISTALSDVDFEVVETYCRECVQEYQAPKDDSQIDINVTDNLVPQKADSDVHELVFKLLLKLVSQQTNYEVFLNYAFNCLLPRAIARASERTETQRLFLIMQLLFINSPITILELYAEMVQTNIAHAYVLLVAITHCSPQGEALLLQCFVLRHLNLHSAFAPMLDEYEFMQRWKYCIAHQDVLAASLGSGDAFAVYLEKYMQSEQVDQFDQRLQLHISHFEHTQAVFVQFGIYTMLLQTLVQKQHFQAILSSYYNIIRKPRGPACALTASMLQSFYCTGDVLTPGYDFSEAFYCAYRCVLDAFSVSLAPAYVRTGAQMQIQTVLSESNPDRAQFSTGAFYLIYILKRLVFSMSAYQIVDLQRFEHGTYILDAEAPVLDDSQNNERFSAFIRSYMRETVILRRAFYFPEIESTVRKVVELCARLVDPMRALRPYCAQSNANDSKDILLQARGEYEPVFWLQQVAFILQMSTQIFNQLTNPEELCDASSNSQFRELLKSSKYIPPIEIFDALQTVTLAISHVSLSAQNYCYVAFSSLLDNIEILMQCSIHREILENQVACILVQLAMACPIKPAITRVIADFVKLQESGHKIPLQGELICCIWQEDQRPDIGEQIAEQLASTCVLECAGKELYGCEWYERAIQHYKLMEIRAALHSK